MAQTTADRFVTLEASGDKTIGKLALCTTPHALPEAVSGDLGMKMKRH